MTPAFQSPRYESRLRHLCNRRIHCSYSLTDDSLARPKEFESPTFRLGGGRSIQLSYGRKYSIIIPLFRDLVKLICRRFALK